MLVAGLFRRLVRIGSIEVIGPQGQRQRFTGGTPGPEVAIRVHDRRTDRRMLLNPRLAVGEAYMDGTLTIERGTLYDFLDFAAINMEVAVVPPIARVIDGCRWLWRRL